MTNIIAKSPYYEYTDADLEWLPAQEPRIEPFFSQRLLPVSTYKENIYLKKIEHLRSSFRVRSDMVPHYSWAIPCDFAIRKIVALGVPIVELAAGNGYWASLIKAAGGDITCYDIKPWVMPWHPVQVGSIPEIAASPADALLLCWPPNDTPMAAEALAAFKGKFLIYVGEGCGGCTGDDAFHNLLVEAWDEIEAIEIPQWLGIHDRVYIYRRLP